MEVKSRIQTLREKASCAMDEFCTSVEDIGVFTYEIVEGSPMIHDNVKIVESNVEPFEFELEQAKQQIIIILRGQWTLILGKTERLLEVTDVVKVPMGGSSKTVLRAKSKGSKFVYVQFR